MLNWISTLNLSLMVNNHTVFDYIIAGAGASGLSLLWELMQSDVAKESSILLLDSSLVPDDSKTWCFWSKDEFKLNPLIHHTWSHIEVTAKQQTFTEPLSDYTYHALKSIDFTRYILEQAENDTRITFCECTVDEFSESGEQVIVHTNKGNFHGKMIFQSIKNPAVSAAGKKEAALIQHFIGWEIETDCALFDPETALLMDFDVPQKNGVTFMYLLPYSPKTALIEYTVFSENTLPPEEYEDELKHYIRTLLASSGNPESGYRILRKEEGEIPMSAERFSPWYCKQVYTLGIVGGHAKPSTGYTFSRVQKRARQLVTALEKGEKLPDNWPSSYRFRVYDLMLLYQLKHNPDVSLTIFKDLFEHNSMDQVFQFLDEQTNFLQELILFSTLPYTPFFQSIWRMRHTILTGV